MNDEYNARPSAGLPWVVSAVLAIALAAASVPAWRHLREQPRPVPAPVHATWTVPDLDVGAGSDHPFGLALAPDGRRISFPATRDGQVQLWLQDLATGALAPVPGTARGAAPFWSPDGSRIGFFADGLMRIVTLADARVETVTKVNRAAGGTWSKSGDVVFADDEGGLSIVSVAGGSGVSPPRALTHPDSNAGEIVHVFPSFLPDGNHLIAFVRAESAARQGLYLVSVDDGARTRLTGSAASGLVARDQIVFATDGALVTQRLDLDKQRLTGRVGVLGVRVGQSPSGALLATAADDAVIFSEPVTTAQQLVWFDRSGEPTGTVGSAGDFWNVRLAPDGRRSLATLLDPLLRTLDIVLFDGRSLMPTRVSLSIDADDSPAWSPDGLRVAWTQAGRSVMVRGAGAVLPADTVARFDESVRVTDWMPDGSALVVARTMPATREDLWIVPVGGGAPQPLVTTPFADVQGAVSPDGRWIAYASDESGRFEVYVDRILDRSPGPGARERVSSGGGSDPRWTRNGQELFFRRGSAIHVATPASGRGQNAAATTSMVFDTRAAVRSFDVTGDGQRFLLSLPAETPPPPARLILNWPDPGR